MRFQCCSRPQIHCLYLKIHSVLDGTSNFSLSNYQNHYHIILTCDRQLRFCLMPEQHQQDHQGVSHRRRISYRISQPKHKINLPTVLYFFWSSFNCPRQNDIWASFWISPAYTPALALIVKSFSEDLAREVEEVWGIDGAQPPEGLNGEEIMFPFSPSGG